MKLTILSCESHKKGLYLLTLKYGDQELIEEVKIAKSLVTYVEYSEKLLHILHKDVGEARNMNQTMFKIYREGTIDLPVTIGDF